MAAKFNMKNIECSICLETFTEPKLLTCHHTFCQECLEQYVAQFKQGNTFPCPICKRIIDIPKGGVKKFTSNFYISDLCGNSTNCEQCSEHNLPLDVFCETCSLCICAKCALKKHSRHNFVDLTVEEEELTSNSFNSKKQTGHVNIPRQSEQKFQDLLEHNTKELAKYSLQEPKQPSLELVEGEVYDFTIVFNIKDVRDYYKLEDLLYIKSENSPWQVGVGYSYTNRVLCDIKLDEDCSKHYKYIEVNVTYKLFNLVNSTRTIEETVRGGMFIFNGEFYSVAVDLPIDLQTLKDPTKGFIDSNGDFKIQTFVKITKLENN